MMFIARSVTEREENMSEQEKAAETKPAAINPSQVAGMDNAGLQILVQLLLAERQEALEEKKEKRLAQERRETQYRLNSQYNTEEREKIQRMCTHLKGGKEGPNRPRSARIDYAVSFHTFIDGRSYIKCLICSSKWKPGDTADFLIRRGQKVKNHTGLGWDQAWNMLKNSTNTPTTSEVVMQATPTPQAQPDFSNPSVVEI